MLVSSFDPGVYRAMGAAFAIEPRLDGPEVVLHVAIVFRDKLVRVVDDKLAPLVPRPKDLFAITHPDFDMHDVMLLFFGLGVEIVSADKDEIARSHLFLREPDREGVELVCLVPLANSKPKFLFKVPLGAPNDTAAVQV